MNTDGIRPIWKRHPFLGLMVVELTVPLYLLNGVFNGLFDGFWEWRSDLEVARRNLRRESQS